MFLICFIPYLLEVSIETWFELKKKVSVNHFWTAVVRGVLMIGIGFFLMATGTTEFWWQGTVLCFGIFVALFNYTYNWITGRPTFYMRSKGIDRIYGYMPWFGRILFELIILGASIQIYVKPEIIL